MLAVGFCLLWVFRADTQVRPYVGDTVLAVDLCLLWVFLLLAGIAAWLWHDTSRSSSEEGDCSGVTAAIHLLLYSEVATLGRWFYFVVLAAMLVMAAKLVSWM